VLVIEPAIFQFVIQRYTTKLSQFLILNTLVHLTKYYFGDEMEDNMGGACSTHGRDEKCSLVGNSEAKKTL
jgi:hypothetical protein